MSRSNKNRRRNNKKKNVGRNQAETSTSPVVDHSVEVPRVDRAENGNDYTDHTEPTGNLWGDRNLSAKDAVTSEKEIKQNIENEIDTKVTSVYNETSISFVSADEVEHQESDLKRKPRAWTYCLSCCGVLDILKAIFKRASS